MLRLNHLQGRDIALWVIALLVVLGDQFTKLWIRSSLAIGESIPAGLFQITHIRNSGAAFGIFQGQSLPLTIVSFTTAAALIYYIIFVPRRLPFLDNILGRTVLGLILGGIVGNLIDRLRFGYVTDFIDFRFWPAFNVADSAVTVGVIALALMLLSAARGMRTDTG